MMKIEKQLVEQLLSLKTPAVIAISGFGGSGKSAFALLLGKKLNAPIIGIDSFIKDKTITDYVNWEVMDFDRLEQEVLIPFEEGKNPIKYGHFDWGKNETIETKEVSHNGFIIIEGVGLFRPKLENYFAYKIWINCSLEDAIARGKKRDREEYKNQQDTNWDGIWKKNDEEYFAAYKPKEIANFIIDNRDLQMKAEKDQQGKKMHADEVDINISLIQRLIATQFPQWADLPIKSVPSAGTDNALYRLGDEMVVRLPRIEKAVKHIDKEYVWLPKIALSLPFAIPTPLAKGKPAEGYPYPWSIYKWLKGDNPTTDYIVKPEVLAKDLVKFVSAMRQITIPDGPTAKRGVPLTIQDAQTRNAIKNLQDMIDTDAATAAWDTALRIPEWSGQAVWIHGDLSPGNVLLINDRLNAVIDFSGLGVGDPACDLIVAWNLLPAEVRHIFRENLEVDDATWARGRGWALSIALIQLPYYKDTNPTLATNAQLVIREVLTSVSEKL